MKFKWLLSSCRVPSFYICTRTILSTWNKNDFANLPVICHRASGGRGVKLIWRANNGWLSQVSLSDSWRASGGWANLKASLAAEFTSKKQDKNNNSFASDKLLLHTSLQKATPSSVSVTFHFPFKLLQIWSQKPELMFNYPEYLWLLLLFFFSRLVTSNIIRHRWLLCSRAPLSARQTNYTGQSKKLHTLVHNLSN